MSSLESVQVRSNLISPYLELLNFYMLAWIGVVFMDRSGFHG